MHWFKIAELKGTSNKNNTWKNICRNMEFTRVWNAIDRKMCITEFKIALRKTSVLRKSLKIAFVDWVSSYGECMDINLMVGKFDIL